MNKIKSFFLGILLLAMTIASIGVVTLVYRANEQISIKSYIFQMGNFANERVGLLQNINDISVIGLRNSLIKKYVSEYFKVIPGESNVTNRPALRELSSSVAYNQWTSGEAKIIDEMSQNKMFRMVWVSDEGIIPMNMPADHDYAQAISAEDIYYAVHYETTTWRESNFMAVEPETEHGVLYIEARFKPGINKNQDVKKYLEAGKDPAGLFMFMVTHIGSKGIK